MRPNRKKANLSAIDDDPVAAAIRDLMNVDPYWHGTTEALLAQLNGWVGETQGRSREWPQTARALTGRLQTAKGALRRVGITINHQRTTHARNLTIKAREADTPSRSANNRHNRHLFSGSRNLHNDDQMTVMTV
jgi:hypothetical protein